MQQILTISLILFSLLLFIHETLCVRPPRRNENVANLKILNYGEFRDSDIRTVRLNDPNNPIQTYQTGYRGRVEYVRAVIRPNNVRNGSPTNNKVRTYARTMGRSSDDAGHIIGNQLGGTGRETYNIFPQSPNVNRGAWSAHERYIRQLVLSTGQPVEVVVQLYYAEPTSTRPHHFFYRAAYNNACHTASVNNP